MISHVVYCSDIQAGREGRGEVAREGGGFVGCIYTTIYAEPTGKRAATHVAAAAAVAKKGISSKYYCVYVCDYMCVIVCECHKVVCTTKRTFSLSLSLSALCICLRLLSHIRSVGHAVFQFNSPNEPHGWLPHTNMNELARHWNI